MLASRDSNPFCTGPRLSIMRYLIALLILLLCAAGCTAPVPTPIDTPPQSPTTIETSRPTTIPTTIPTTAGLPLDVTINSLGTYVSDTEYQQPKAGYQFMLVDFSIRNVGERPAYRYNPNDVDLRDPDMYQYGYHQVSYLIPGAFESTVIPLGETRRGKLVFEVPAKWADGTRYYLSVS